MQITDDISGLGGTFGNTIESFLGSLGCTAILRLHCNVSAVAIVFVVSLLTSAACHPSYM